MRHEIIWATVMVASIMLVISGRLAQLVRAAALHAVGQGFESLVAHLKCLEKPIAPMLDPHYFYVY